MSLGERMILRIVYTFFEEKTTPILFTSMIIQDIVAVICIVLNS